MRTERFEIEHGPCRGQKQLDGFVHGSGVEVSGSAVSARLLTAALCTLG